MSGSHFTSPPAPPVFPVGHIKPGCLTMRDKIMIIWQSRTRAIMLEICWLHHLNNATWKKSQKIMLLTWITCRCKTCFVSETWRNILDLFSISCSAMKRFFSSRWPDPHQNCISNIFPVSDCESESCSCRVTSPPPAERSTGWGWTSKLRPVVETTERSEVTTLASPQPRSHLSASGHQLQTLTETGNTSE